MSLNPKESGEFIVKNAKHLSIDANGIQNLVKEVRCTIAKKFSYQNYVSLSQSKNK